MTTRKLTRIGEVLPSVLKRLGLEQRFKEQAVLALWPDVVGAELASRTRATRIDKGVLYVYVDHGAWMQELHFIETDGDIAEYDGHHIAVYVSSFSGPHDILAERGLITEESDQCQYRFQAIVDPESGETLTELEHEVRALSHPMYHRPLVNRNPAVSFFTYRKGAEIFTPT